MSWLFSRSADHLVVSLPQETGKLSLSYWFKHTTTPGSGFPNRHFVVVRGADPLSQANYYVYHDSTKIALGWTTSASVYQEVYGTWTADLNEHHCLIAVDWDNDTVQVYLDGIALSMTTTGINTTPQTTGTSMLIGRLQVGSAEGFGGHLADLAIWQSVALGGPDAILLTARVSPAMIRPSNLTRYWRFSANSPGVIYEERMGALPTSITGAPLRSMPPSGIRGAGAPELPPSWINLVVGITAAGGTTIPVFMHHYVQQRAA